MLDETEFLSDYGIRAISKHHEEHPYVFDVDGMDLSVRYLPGGIGQPACSAAIRIGAGRSGSRLTIC